ncbi:MAG: hypothetical protein ACQESB_00030 [Elusimicrobiota bacterium]
MNKNSKAELLKHLKELEESWKKEKQKFINEKREDMQQIRSLKKRIEVISEKYKLNLAVKEESLEAIKLAFGSRVKKWDREFYELKEERDNLKKRVENLEENISITRRDSRMKIDKLKDEMSQRINELKKNHGERVKKLKEELEKEKEKQIREAVEKNKIQIKKEAEEMITRQKKLWEKDLRKKEEEMKKQRNKWEEEYESRRIELEKREKEYIEDLLEKFKND